MFKSKLDKILCCISLLLIGFYYGVKGGTEALAPFAACYLLALGMSVKPPTNKLTT